MKKELTLSNKLLYFILLIVVFLFSTNYLFAQARGRIVGRVTDASNNNLLPGANVNVTGTSFGAATDLSGEFIINQVPPGNYTLKVSFIGYEEMSAQVTVEANKTVRQDFALAEVTLKGQEVVVWGVRAKGQAIALSQQKNAPNILNIVAADQMGRFPDASAPEAVQRIPGISIQRDMGEGRYIQIRGGSPQMTSVTFNGERVPTPEGDVRQIALDAVPVDILESIEVSKAITPDMDADAIGGSVNLVTKRATDKRVLGFEAAGGFAPIRDDLSGNGSLTYGNRVMAGKFGYLLSGSFSRRNFGADDIEVAYSLEDPGLDDDLMDELEARHYTLWRSRLGGTAMFDYRLSDNSLLYLNGIYTEMQDDEQRRRLRHRVGKGDYQDDGSVTDGQLVFQHKSRREKLRAMNFTAGGEHKLQSGLSLDYHLTASRSEEDTPRDNEIIFVQKKVDFFPNFSDPDNVQANPEAGTIDGEYKFDAIEPASSLTRDTDYLAAFNFSLPYRFGDQSIGKLKLGAKFRNKTKNRDVSENAYELKDGEDDIILGQGIGQSFSTEGFNPGDYPFPSQLTSMDDVDGFMDKYGSKLDGGHVIEDDVEDYEVSEQTIAAYAMTEINFSPSFMLLPGVRFERTKVNADGYSYDADTETLEPTQGEKTYNKIFPMIHARYRLTSQTNIRAAFTSALARPNFFDLVPYRVRDAEDRTLGNPNLVPSTSLNFDLMLEHYDPLIGIISGGTFYKSLSDPIFQFVTKNEFGGETFQPNNGESGYIFGLEFAVQRQLKFLPAPFDGLGIYGNYTYTNSEATLPSGVKTKFPGQPDNVYNIALSYEKKGFSGQISANYHDAFVDEFAGDLYGSEVPKERESDVYIDKHFQLDFSASYLITPSITAFLELVNITNEPLRFYQGTTRRPRQLEYYEPWGRLGLKFSL